MTLTVWILVMWTTVTGAASPFAVMSSTEVQCPADRARAIARAEVLGAACVAVAIPAKAQQP